MQARPKATRSATGSPEDSDDRKWETNVRAGQLLADTIRTTLGPKGLDKMLVTAEGRVVVTNDGASILDRMELAHPVATIILAVAEQQDRKAGDGTTSAVLLAGELLGAAESLREKGVHPTKIAEGYQIAAARAKPIVEDLSVAGVRDTDDRLEDVARTVITGKWGPTAADFLAALAVETVRKIERDERVAFERITRKTLPGGSFYDSAVVDGLVVDLEESSTTLALPEDRLQSAHRDATVALVDEALDIDRATGMGTVTLESHADYRAFTDYERQVYDAYVDTLVDLGVDVVFCQQSIDKPVRYRLADEGILAVERTRRDELEKLARATGARPVTVGSLSPSTVGQATGVRRRTAGPTDVVVVSGYEGFDQVTLLARGGTEHVAAETRRMLDDCFHVLKFAIEDGDLLPGGGATEMELARRLRSDACRRDGKEQLAIEAFADALETVPETLARTAGMDPIDALVALRAAHNDEWATAGLDLDAKSVADVVDRGVLEPLHVKWRAISGAAEAASTVVRIDDTIPITRDEPEEGHEEGHDHGGLAHSTEGYPWAIGHSMGD